MASAAYEILQERAADWALIVLAGIAYLFLEQTEPFHREFRLDDPSIQHAKAKNEHVSNALCIVITFAIPLVAVAVIPLGLFRRKNRIALIHTSIVGLLAAFVLDGVLVDTLKIWLGRPRPDMLSRCQPAKGTPTDKYVTIEVCTTKHLSSLHEGFKSTPSGHSATSFTCLTFFALWLAGQTLALRPGAGLFRPVVSFLPLVLAAYIAISRTEDYRHHYFDVMFGSAIGLVLGWAIYRRYFPAITATNCNVPHATEAERTDSRQSASLEV